MRYLSLLAIIFFSILYIGCYSVESVSFVHENYSRSGNPYDDHRHYNIIPTYHDEKGFLTAIRTNNSGYVYKSSLFWIKDKIFVFKIDVSIYSEKGIDNIKINNCEIIFNNFSVILNENELTDGITGTSKNSIKPYIRNYMIVEKEIDVKTIDNYLGKIKSGSIQNFITLNIDINYEENGEIKNWKNSTKYFIDIGHTTYTPKNLWGGLP